MTSLKLDFYDEQVLLRRLTEHGSGRTRNIIFLVGAPLTSPSDQQLLGVPGVDGVINLIKDEFKEQGSVLSDFENMISGGGGRRYQEAFKFLLGQSGQDSVNQIIRKAVIKARISPISVESLDNSEQAYKDLENDNKGWWLPKGVTALGEILSKNADRFGVTILTSNFDPLIEIAIKRAGGQCYRTVLHQDGNLAQTTADGSHVVHFHGYWYGCDTLHTPLQLNQMRPQLKASLSRLIMDSTVVVLGYGGWDDVFTQALIDVTTNATATPDIIWTFFESDENKISVGHENVIKSLLPGITRGRVTLYKGIDCNSFLPSLLEKLPIKSQSSKGNSATYLRTVSHRDNPPITKEWVGRGKELQLLIENDSPAVIITGIGGHGKSSLAAHYLQLSENSKTPYNFWDWKDCREEGDTLQTQLISIIEQITDQRIGPCELQGQDVKSMVATLFEVIGDSRNLIVFDNVDHYIDMESYEPTSGVRILIDKIVSCKHSSKFIFTCRPKVQHDSPHVLKIPLDSGLSLQETVELFNKLKVPSDQIKYATQAHIITNGHPLWLNLLAVQAQRGTSLSDLLKNIKRGIGDLPEKTLRSIWVTLTDKQKYMLRMMAELVKPISEDQLSQLIEPELHYNQFVKTIKGLKTLNLVVVKSSKNAPDSVELHPLIREFIRANFHRKERDEFVNVLISFLDCNIGKYRPVLVKAPSMAILEHWTQKVELNINRGNYTEALATLSEVDSPLLSRGFAEEFVRLARSIFTDIDWIEVSNEKVPFDSVFSHFVETLTQLGDNLSADEMLEKYKSSIPGKSAQYISYCNLTCYALWYRKDFRNAIFWGEKGEELKSSSKVTTNFSCAHNLALSWRDGGNVKPALNYFLKGKTLEEILSRKTTENPMSGTDYGNIGRCLFFLKDYAGALACYKESHRLLDEEGQSVCTPLNQGYVRAWIAEVLTESGELGLGYCFYRAAFEKWRVISPPRAQEILATTNAIIGNIKNIIELQNLTATEIEIRCEKWLKS